MTIIVWSACAQGERDRVEYKTLYEDQLPYFQELITGGQYADSPKYYDGHPFYKSRTFELGTLSINGILYTEVPLLYDDLADWVVTFHPVYNQKILIKSEKVDQFSLGDGSVFRNFENNQNYLHDRNGFYQVLYDQEIKVLAKRYKELKAVKEVGNYTKEYESYEDYFLFYQNEFRTIRKKKQAIKALGLSKKDVKRHLRGRSLYFRANKEEYLLELVKLRASSSEPFEGFAE
ncbi:hypothetical protein PBT90_01650 [Algoriphagus halophytocola]|uniref:Lipoprotein n=1 Tax=Algoriphagus halophytocola TaxID=2991499 RepID=A0ABY6MEV5_9BACT|nr:MULTISPECIES: hypothetical protein [unclassified Algoriphagus]UZD22158.1 hypothetical protein OM944_15975 [Algoriphagus sp. TR-M5]WBL43409.1 hypothetical protein PBT90_01650 [Algoriphagus sp. TR-M9]